MKFIYSILILSAVGCGSVQAQTRSAYIPQYPSPTGDAELRKKHDTSKLRLTNIGSILEITRTENLHIYGGRNSVRVSTSNGVSKIKVSDSLIIYYRGIIDSAKCNGKTFKVNY